MEKYLKIHWSIKIILGFILFTSILLIIQSIYLIIFYKGIQETLTILGSETRKYITIPTILFGFIIQLLIIIVIYKVLNYKRWAIMIVFIFIGFPLSGFVLGTIGLIIYNLFINFFHSCGCIEGDKILISLIYIIILLLAWFSIKTNIELIRLYKNIGNPELIEESKFQDKKPKFLNIFLVSISPIIILSGLMIVLYNPVVPLDIPDGYFKINGFNLDNPVYTDQIICKKFQDELAKYFDPSDYMIGRNTSTGVILKIYEQKSITNIQNRLALIKEVGINEDTYKKSMEKMKIYGVSQLKKINKYELGKKENEITLEKYIQENPEQWEEDIRTLKSILANESILQLQDLINKLPQDFQCNIRDTKTIASELYPGLTGLLKTSRLFKYAIQLAVMESNIDVAIERLRSMHDFNKKIFNSNATLVRGMIGIALLNIEFGSVEYIVENSNPEQMEQIREIYTIPYNIKENQINVWKGEYYFLEHIVTGKGKSIKQISIPYIFNGEDMLNRGIILIYARAIAEAQNNTNLLQKIYENQILNNKNFLTPTEQGFLQEGTSTWKNSNIIFARFYNPVGKILLKTLLPKFTDYQKSYHNISIYQDYIRYDLLGIEK